MLKAPGGVIFLYLPMVGRLLDDKSVAAANERRTAKEHENGCTLSVDSCGAGFAFSVLGALYFLVHFLIVYGRI